jgi:hypothetical protein
MISFECGRPPCKRPHFAESQSISSTSASPP